MPTCGASAAASVSAAPGPTRRARRRAGYRPRDHAGSRIQSTRRDAQPPAEVRGRCRDRFLEVASTPRAISTGAAGSISVAVPTCTAHAPASSTRPRPRPSDATAARSRHSGSARATSKTARSVSGLSPARQPAGHRAERRPERLGFDPQRRRRPDQREPGAPARTRRGDLDDRAPPRGASRTPGSMTSARPRRRSRRPVRREPEDGSLELLVRPRQPNSIPRSRAALGGRW